MLSAVRRLHLCCLFVPPVFTCVARCRLPSSLSIVYHSMSSEKVMITRRLCHQTWIATTLALCTVLSESLAIHPEPFQAQWLDAAPQPVDWPPAQRLPALGAGHPVRAYEQLVDVPAVQEQCQALLHSLQAHYWQPLALVAASHTQPERRRPAARSPALGCCRRRFAERQSV